MGKDGGRDVLHGREGSYALLDVIGKGAFGTVYKGIWREVGRHVAVKRVDRARLSIEEKKALRDEILLFKNLKHQHIVNYIEAVDDHASPFLDIVMEFVEGGSLFNMVDQIRRSLDVGEPVFEERVVADLVRQVVLGLQYLHDQGVVHRDIKGANLLVTKEGHVKLADFGVASTKPADNSSPIDVAGSPYWMAPEIITLTGSSTASDIWSLGCTVIELITGLPPYHQYEDITALFKIVSDDCPPMPPNLSSECEDFLRKCFNKDIHVRATAEELLLHRWLVRKEQSAAQSTDPAMDLLGFDTVKLDENAILPAPDSNPLAPLDKYEEDGEDDFDDIDFELPDTFTDGLDNGNSAVDSFSFGIGNDTPPYSSPLPRDMSPRHASLSDDRSAPGPSTKSNMGAKLTQAMRCMSFREDPFKDLMDDPEVDRERERLRKQKELWQLVKMHVASLGKDDDTHIAACEGLMDIFKTNPEQRFNLIYDPGLLPIIEVLESGGNGSSRAVEAMLQVTLSFLNDINAENGGSEIGGKLGEQKSGDIPSLGYPRISNIREDLCLAGFLPVVMRYCHPAKSFNCRILAARFLHKMLELERVLHMFIACRGFSVFVEMLEPDIVHAGELSKIALYEIDKLLTMDNQRHKRDFCRRFAWSGLLDRIIDGISYNMDYLKKMSQGAECSNVTSEVDGVNESICSMGDLRVHITKLASLLQTFAARADPTVKVRMTTKRVLHTIIGQIRNALMPLSAIQSILCCIRDLSRDPQTHEALQSAGAIETLVQYLSEEHGYEISSEHFIISSLHNLCIVSLARQEAMARAGFVPYLQRIILSKDMNVRSLCIDMYSGLACASSATRVELGKHNGVDFYVQLMVLLCAPGTVRKWQARVLQSMSEWLEDENQGKMVEKRLIAERNRRRFCESLAQMRVNEVEGVLEPYLKMVAISDSFNHVFGASQELIVAMVRWLEDMYGSRGGGNGPRVRLLLLRTLLAHARMWSNGNLNRGVISGLRVLLTEVVLISEGAITVREQASLLLSAIDNPN